MKEYLFKILPTIQQEKAVPFLLLGGALIYYLTFFNYGLEVDDEGYFLLGAADVLRGKWPIADFVSYPPLSYWLLAGAFKLFGNGVLTERFVLLPFLLANGFAVYWIARRILPLNWSIAVAGMYIFAPGPQYRLFFTSSILLMAVSAIFYLYKPNLKRAILLGLAIGIGTTFRKEIGFLGLPYMLGVTTLPFLRKWITEKSTNIKFLAAHLICGIMGFATPVAIVILIYIVAGKFSALVENASRFMFNSYTREMLAKMGVLTEFNPLLIIKKLDAEQFFYTLGLTSVVLFLLNSIYSFFRYREMRDDTEMLKIAIGAAALASMTYCFLFVWGTRILLTFPLVYICYAAVLGLLVFSFHNPRMRALVFVIGIAALLLPYISFLKHQNYSGSITTRLAPTFSINHPKLRGVYPYEENRLDIENLAREMAKAPPNATLVSMSESTTMGYLSGLENPTIYRAFGLEFSRPGEEEKAIETFERMKITYFVARRKQFLEDGGPASNLDVYAPKIKDYLVNNYDIIPLGQNFVLLRRRDLFSG